MQYRARKNKWTRVSYRVVGGIFIAIGVAQIWGALHMESGGRFLLAALALFLIGYAGYLIKMSFRRQAYDITYVFEEAGIKIVHHRGEELVPYADVQDVQILAPDPDLPYRIVRIKIHGVNYVLSFKNNIPMSEKIFQYVFTRVEFPEVTKDETENS